MTAQPEARRLADALECHYSHNMRLQMDAADELRRLHEVELYLDQVVRGFYKATARNAELQKALKGQSELMVEVALELKSPRLPIATTVAASIKMLAEASKEGLATSN